MNNKKGFTLVEILVVIVILSVFSTLVVAIISNYLEKGKTIYDNKLENLFLLSGKEYYASNANKLPESGESAIVTLAELRSFNFVNKDFIDAYGNKCSNEDSLVMVSNSQGKYNYVACLYCPNSEKFSDAHLELCDPINLEFELEPEPEPIKCQIKKTGNKFIVYDKDGNSKEMSGGIEAINEFNESCDINRNECQINEYEIDDENTIKYYYGSDKKIYVSEEEAQKSGVCQTVKVCSYYTLENGGLTSDYKSGATTISSISQISKLSNVFNNPVTSIKSNATYYLHYVKSKAYNDVLSTSSSSISETATNGSTSTLSEYFNPSKKAKVIKSTNAIIHYNEQIPDEYELLLAKSATASEVTIPSGLKMSQKQINQWGTDFSDYAQYGRVVIASDDAKGNYKARYKNVGTYNGTQVDVLMTLTGFSGCKLKSKATKCGIWFEPELLEVYSLGVKRISVKYEFFKSGTNTPIKVKGYSTYWDIDANQGIHFVKGTTGIYAYGDNELYVSSLNNAPYLFEYFDKKYSGYDEKGAITETFSGSVLNKSFVFMSGNDGDHSKVTSSYGSIVPSTVPIGISKEYVGSVNSSSVLKTDQIVKFRIRYSNISSSAKTLTITDTLTSNMNYQKGSTKFNDGSTTNPTVSGNKLIWTKKVAAHSRGYFSYQVKISSCGDLAKSTAKLTGGSTTFTSQTLKNIVVCSKKLNTICHYD